MLNAISSRPVFTEVQKENPSFRLKKACAEFESIFIAHMLKSMRAGMGEDRLFFNDNAGRMIESMSDETLALSIAQGGGMGLADMLAERLKP